MTYRNCLVITSPNHDLQEGWVFIIFSLDGEKIKISDQAYPTKQLAEEAGQSWIDAQYGDEA